MREGEKAKTGKRKIEDQARESETPGDNEKMLHVWSFLFTFVELCNALLRAYPVHQGLPLVGMGMKLKNVFAF